MTRGRQANHAHVVTDGHDHGELDLGHKSGFHGFADAIVRNPDGDTSATTVRKAWIAGEAERKFARQADRMDGYNRQTWRNAKLMIPSAARADISVFDDQIVRALSTTKGSVPALITAAIRSTDWHHPDAAAGFVDRLTTKQVTSRPASHKWQEHTSRQPNER